MNPESWMSKLDSNLAKRPINYLHIPGSHDSFTCDITENSDIGPDVRPLSLLFMKLTRYLGKKFLKYWLITQNCNATDQLKKGVRYFDLRVGRNLDFYITHQLFSGKLSMYLNEISMFLNENPKEVVLLDFNHIYLNEDEHEMLTQLIIKIFGDKIAPRCDYKEIPSLETLGQHSHQVLIFYHRTETINEKFWPGGDIPSYWPNTTDINQMVQYLETSLGKKVKTKFHISQGILTPTWKTIVFHPFSSLENFLAYKSSQAVLEWLEGLQEFGKTNLNIVIVDFAKPNLIDKIIKMNK